MITITTLRSTKKVLFKPISLNTSKTQKDNHRFFRQYGYTLFLSFLLLLLSNASNGQAFSGTYAFGSVTTTSGLTDPTPVPTATGVTFGSFTAVGQISTNPNASSRFSFTNQALAPTLSNTTNSTCVCDGAILTTRYYQVTITVAAGFNVNLSSIIFTSQRSSSGARQYAVRSDADGYAANLPASISPANPALTVVATNVFQISDTSTAAVAQNGSTITLSGASFTGLSPGSTRTFRVYGWNAEALTGSFGIDNFVMKKDSVGLLNLTLLLCGLLIAEALVQFTNEYLCNFLGQHIIKDIRTKIFSHILNFKLTKFILIFKSS